MMWWGWFGVWPMIWLAIIIGLCAFHNDFDRERMSKDIEKNGTYYMVMSTLFTLFISALVHGYLEKISQ